MSPNEIIYALQSWPAKIAELNELLKADRAELAAAKAECERLTANQRQPAEDIFVSHLCDELTRLRVEVERWKTVAAQMTAEREHNANEAALSRAEVERLKTCGIVEIAASNSSVLDYCKHWEARAEKAEARVAFLETAYDGASASQRMAIARAKKAEAALAFIAENGGTTHETECGTISCNGSWCAEQARAETAEAALADWSVLNLWGGTPEIIHEFVKGQQTRIHHCQDLEAELTALAAERDQLRTEVDRLNDIINRAGVQFFHDGTDGQTAAKMLTVLNETKLLKNETTTP
jgi:hypothetical protein